MTNSHLPSPGSKIYTREDQLDNGTGHLPDELLAEEKESELLALWVFRSCCPSHLQLWCQRSEQGETRCRAIFLEFAHSDPRLSTMARP
jgi:hypothetical protein